MLMPGQYALPGRPADVPDQSLAERLFNTLLTSPQGSPFSVHSYEEMWSLVETPDRKVRLVIPELLEWLSRLDVGQTNPNPDFPFVLAAGQRRMFNANQIFRDPAWRRSDPDGALLINPEDLAQLDRPTALLPASRAWSRGAGADDDSSGAASRPAHASARRTRQRRHAADQRTAHNLLTSAETATDRRTPYHKNVPVR